MTTLPSLLMDIPEKGCMWVCLAHGHFGYADTPDESFAMSEEHYCHYVPAALHDACDLIREAWDEGEDDEESAENVTLQIELIRMWHEFDDAPDALFAFDGSVVGMDNLVNRLHVAPCQIIHINLPAAMARYRSSSDEVTLFSVQQKVPMLVAAQMVDNIYTLTTDYNLGEVMAEQIADWLNSPEAK